MSPEQSVHHSLSYLRAHAALIQLAGVFGCIVALVFPDHVPLWAIYGSLAGLVMLLVAGRLLTGRFVVRTPVDIPVLLLLLLLPLNLLVTADHNLTLPHVYKVIGSVALFYAIVGVLEKPKSTLSTLAIGVLTGVLTVLVLFGTRWGGGGISFLPFDPYRFFPRRVHAFWNPDGFNPNIAGGTLAMLLPVLIAYAFFGNNQLARLGVALETGVVGFTLLLTRSYGALVAVAAGVAAMLVVHNRRWLIVVAILVACAVPVWQAVGDDAQALVLDANVESAIRSAQGRMELWSRGLYMLQGFPFTGVGLGMVVKVLPLLYPISLVPLDSDVEHVHNLYLQAGADAGFPGVIATLAFLLGMLHLCWRAALQARGTKFEPLAAGMLGTVVVFAVHGMTDTITFYTKAHIIAWALFGVAAAVGSHLVRCGGSPNTEATGAIATQAAGGTSIDG